MTFRVNNRLSAGFFLLLFTVASSPASSQKNKPVENSIFWEVRGKDLSKPSYLFGTFHLMGSNYVDSLDHVSEKFLESKTIVGEILLDSTLTMKMMLAARMNDNSLDRLLTPDEYEATASWLKELSGYDLSMFNGMNPMTIQIFLMTMLQQKYFPLSGPKDVPMDMYFQSQAKKAGKKLVGLETFETQMNALFEQFSPQRQAEMLTKFVNEKERALLEIKSMNKSYRDGNLQDLEKMLSDQTYTLTESEVLLDNRNRKWMETLPKLMKEQSTFVAVGALHLSGENGLVTLFRKAGYKVTPISPN